MSATVETTTSQGRIVQVLGAIVDVEFPADALPEINNALTTTVELTSQGEGEADYQMTLEVSQHLGDNVVRCIAMKPTDGLVRGAVVQNTGSAITVPVGDVTKGHVFNVLGECLNLEEGEKLEVTERWPIHRKAPAFDELEPETRM
ncbi:MAG: F0F1 ATP synthase subunit beta, partial [Ancrocorticia populi]